MNESKKRLFVFHGCDRKVGTTMVSHSFAKILSDKMPEKNVLFVAVNGNDDVHYLSGCKSGISSLKMRIDNNLLTADELKNSCDKDNGLYVICGVSGVSNHRSYSVEFASMLFKKAFEIFDIVVADAGNELDSGLCIGALKSGGMPIMVLNQNETCLKRMENSMKVYDFIGIKFNNYVVNRYIVQDPHDVSYLKKRLKTDPEDRFFKIRDEKEYSRIAEIDEQLILNYKSSGYRDDIQEMTKSIIKSSGLWEEDSGKVERKKFLSIF